MLVFYAGLRYNGFIRNKNRQSAEVCEFMKIRKLIGLPFITLVVVFLASCGSQPESEPPRQWLEEAHGNLAIYHIEHINDNFYNRIAFSQREQEMADWIVTQLLDMGYTYDCIYIQGFSRDDVGGYLRHTWDTIAEAFYWLDVDVMGFYSQNVILTVPGQSQQTIIVGAHYDSLPLPGASDNASGVSLLLESAYRMRYEEPYHTIVYAFFGAEEIGLLGAFFYYNSLSESQLDDMVMMINADSLFEGEFPIYGAGTLLRSGSALNHEVFWAHSDNNVSRQVHSIAREINQTHDVNITWLPTATTNVGSDHRVFLLEGHTVVILAGGHWHRYGVYDFLGGGWGSFGGYTIANRILHTDMDCFHYINQRWPNKIQRAMETYSIFLEQILLGEFGG